MIVKATLTINVDPKEWDATYGNGDSPNEVRADVRLYVMNQVREAPGFEESGATVTLKESTQV